MMISKRSILMIITITGLVLANTAMISANEQMVYTRINDVVVGDIFGYRDIINNNESGVIIPFDLVDYEILNKGEGFMSTTADSCGNMIFGADFFTNSSFATVVSVDFSSICDYGTEISYPYGSRQFSEDGITVEISTNTTTFEIADLTGELYLYQDNVGPKVNEFGVFINFVDGGVESVEYEELTVEWEETSNTEDVVYGTFIGLVSGLFLFWLGRKNTRKI